MENSCAELVLCIINQGYEEKVVDCARKLGVKGGTYLNARGVAKMEAEKLFGISIQPEKQIIMMIINNQCKDKLLKSLYNNFGISSEAQGIAFCLPVEDMTENLTKQLFGEDKEEK